MRTRLDHRDLAVRHPPAGPAGQYGARRARAGRVRWWFRAGAWVAVTGLTRLTRTARRRWPVMFLVAGVLLMISGLMLRSTVAFIAGMLAAGSSAEGRSPSPTAAMVRMSERLHKRQADHL